MLAGMISSLLLPGPRSSPGPSRPWRIGTRPGPGRCPGRAQKYRPRARSPCDGGCPEERREQSWLSTPSQRREAFDSAPGGKIGASVGRGLGHPGAPPRPPALSMGPAPPCSIRRIPAALRPRRSALGPPERPRRAAPRRAPPRPRRRRRRRPRELRAQVCVCWRGAPSTRAAGCARRSQVRHLRRVPV